MSTSSIFQIPSGYERGIRFGANWTMAISPYLILNFILNIIPEGSNGSEGIAATLEFAGKSPLAYKAFVLVDGLFHALFFITTVTLFAMLRSAFPVRASLILVCGAWQMITGYTKGLMSSYIFTGLGAAYLPYSRCNAARHAHSRGECRERFTICPAIDGFFGSNVRMDSRFASS